MVNRWCSESKIFLTVFLVSILTIPGFAQTTGNVKNHSNKYNIVSDTYLADSFSYELSSFAE